MARLFSCVFVLLSACADFPELEGTVSPEAANAPFLDFLTVDELERVESAAAAPQDDARADPLAARLARLRARADALRGPVFSTGDRARLSGAPG